MAKGREQYEARVAELQLLGKDLARRARSTCELCEKNREGLRIVEVPPAPKSPDPGFCVLLCEECERAALAPGKAEKGEHWRCLAQSVWSEVPAVQVLAVRLLRALAETEDWARETLDAVFLDEAIEKWVTEVD